MYEVICTATDSETDEPLVIYRSQDTHELWVRPLRMFTESVLSEGQLRPRFERIAELAPTRQRAFA